MTTEQILFVGWVSLVNSLFFLMMAFVMTTQNWQSHLIFKFIPFLSGVASLLGSAYCFDWI